MRELNWNYFWKSSLISTYTFRLSPGKVFTWDMFRVVKPKEQDEKNLSHCLHLKFKCYNFCEIFWKRNQSDFFFESRGHFTKIKKFYKMAVLLHDQVPENTDFSIILKTRINELQTSFRLRQFSLELVGSRASSQQLQMWFSERFSHQNLLRSLLRLLFLLRWNKYDIPKFHLTFWLCNNFDIIDRNNVLFLETTSINHLIN